MRTTQQRLDNELSNKHKFPEQLKALLDNATAMKNTRKRNHVKLKKEFVETNKVRSCVVGIFTCGTFEIPFVYTVPRVRGEYTRQLPPAHAMRCLIFKFSATPVPSLISEIGQGWKNQVQHRRRAGLWANLLIVSL
jgi:hypothetical protein